MTQTPMVLVVEDQQSERNAMVRLLRMEKYGVLPARNLQEAIAQRTQPIQLVISDLKLGSSSGIELLRQWKKWRPATPFILVTAYGDVESAVSAMKLGADDFLTKPINPDELLNLVRKAVGAGEAAGPQRQSEDRLGFESIVGNSPVMLDVFGRVRRAAQSDSLVLVLGESGTGKELISQAIHQHSPRSKGPFVAVNMAAIPENLVESELFGHVAGAFTGATGNRTGKFSAANEGTIFIDEIGDFEIGLQAKLLRVLETLTVTPVGGNDEQRVNVRVVAATSRNLAEMVSRREFREDLYYRLTVVTIELPPLRARRDDIPVLVSSFLANTCCANQRPTPAISPELAHFLANFDWPGNVRQLRNAVESMAVMATGPTLTLEDLPAHLRGEGGGVAHGWPLDAESSLEGIERMAVLQALERFQGNRTHAAEALGISVRTLQRRLKSWDIGDDAGP